MSIFLYVSSLPKTVSDSEYFVNILTNQKSIKLCHSMIRLFNNIQFIFAASK